LQVMKRRNEKKDFRGRKNDANRPYLQITSFPLLKPRTKATAGRQKMAREKNLKRSR